MEKKEKYELPDGQVITIGKERFVCPEAIFQPTILGKEIWGIETMTYEAIMECPIDIRKDMFSNILLAGGCTMFPGFAERLQQEMMRLAPPGVEINVRGPIALPKREHFSWYGGSMFASEPAWQRSWFTKEEYDEYGPHAAHHKYI